MQRKSFAGWVLVVIGALGLLRLPAHFQADPSAMGALTGGILFVLLGAWLIRSGRTRARR